MGLFTPENINYLNYFDRARYILAWRLSLLFSFIFFALSIVFIFDDEKTMFFYVFSFIITFAAFFYLKTTSNYKPVFTLYSVAGLLMTHFAVNLIPDSVHFVDFLWMMVTSLLAFFGLGVAYGFIILVLNAIGMMFFTMYSLNFQIAVIKEQSVYQLIALNAEFVFVTFSIGYIVYQFVHLQKYAEVKMQFANDSLQSKNQLIQTQHKEKTVLLKEIHHRVKNNLQIIVSLLRMQKSDLKSEEAKKHFNEAIKRIMVMSLIHQKLYQEKELANVNLKEYVEELADESKSVSLGEFPVDIKIITDVKTVGLKTIVPLGLLINELLANSFKYAFRGKTSGKIDITICQEGNDYTFTYSDNGDWKEPEEGHVGFGLELINILTEQLEGTVNRENTKGETIYKFWLKNLDLK